MEEKQLKKAIISLLVILVITNGMWSITGIYFLHESKLGKEINVTELHYDIHGDGFEIAGASIYDVNRDKKISLEDVGCIWNYINNQTSSYPYDFKVWKTEPNPYAERLYDVNCDGIVDKADMDLVIKWKNC